MSRSRLLAATIVTLVLAACAAPTEPRSARLVTPTAPAADSIPDSNCISGYSVGNGICA
jgi:hypothetical protein